MHFKLNAKAWNNLPGGFFPLDVISEDVGCSRVVPWSTSIPKITVNPIKVKNSLHGKIVVRSFIISFESSLVLWVSICFHVELEEGIKLIKHIARKTPHANEFAKLRHVCVPFDKFSIFGYFWVKLVDAKPSFVDNL